MHQIVKDKIEFKNIGLSNDCIDFIKRLTNKNMIFRLGYSGIQEIKNHSFFNMINWQKIKNMEYQPPFSIGVKDCKEKDLIRFREFEQKTEIQRYLKIVGYSFN